MRTSSSSGDHASAAALRRLLRPFSLHSSTIAWYPGGARKCNARAMPGSAENPSSFSASSIISSASGILRLLTSTLPCAAFVDLIFPSPYVVALARTHPRLPGRLFGLYRGFTAQRVAQAEAPSVLNLGYHDKIISGSRSPINEPSLRTPPNNAVTTPVKADGALCQPQ